MTIALESEIVGTGFDPVRDVYTYTIARNGKRWTVDVPAKHLDAHKGPAGKTLRRKHVATVLEAAMNGEPDVAS